MKVEVLKKAEALVQGWKGLWSCSFKAPLIRSSDLPHPASLLDGFFLDSNLRVKPLSRFAEGKIKPNHIHEGHQESNPEAVAVKPLVPLIVLPGRAHVTKEGNLQ